MWDFIDVQRSGIIPGLYDSRFGWEDYAVDVLSTPMMFADLTHTPEAADLPAEQLHRVAFRDNANDIYPDRELNPYEINHVLSTHFNDVRLKNFIELRHWDSLPIARAERLTEIVGSLFYSDDNFGHLTSYFDGVSESEVMEAKANLQAHGDQSTPYGQPLEFWQEFLGLEGLLADEPGDPNHPDVFQK
jgi:glutamate--cysteine ligase